MGARLLDADGRSGRLAAEVPVVAIVTVAPLEVVAKLQLAPAGSPEQANASDWLKPSIGVIPKAALPLCPGLAIVIVVGVALIWKSTTFRDPVCEVDPV